jgi:hypothetical protein
MEGKFHATVDVFAEGQAYTIFDDRKFVLANYLLR